MAVGCRASISSDNRWPEIAGELLESLWLRVALERVASPTNAWLTTLTAEAYARRGEERVPLFGLWSVPRNSF
jgi:hypothetical protein